MDYLNARQLGANSITVLEEIMCKKLSAPILYIRGLSIGFTESPTKIRKNSEDNFGGISR